ACPPRGPSLHVPPFTPSPTTGSPTHCGHGRARPRPLCTADSTRTAVSLSPACGPVSDTLTVPVIGCVKRFMMQPGAPPEDTGRIAPLKHSHVSAPVLADASGSQATIELA